MDGMVGNSSLRRLRYFMHPPLVGGDSSEVNKSMGRFLIVALLTVISFAFFFCICNTA